MQRADLPERAVLTRLFAPTGPVQEVALSSGWADRAGVLSADVDRLVPMLWPPNAAPFP